MASPKDAAVLRQVNERGDVNVSGMGPMLRIGCGGFIDISQSARRLVFVGTLRSGNSQARPALSLLFCEQADHDAPLAAPWGLLPCRVRNAMHHAAVLDAALSMSGGLRLALRAPGHAAGKPEGGGRRRAQVCERRRHRDHLCWVHRGRPRGAALVKYCH